MQKLKTINLHSEHWKEVIAEIKRRNERQEKEYSVSTFVDKDLLIRLRKNNNQIVWGRRGTGKTHLFRTLYEDFKRSFEDEKVLPVHLQQDKGNMRQMNCPHTALGKLFLYPVAIA